MKYIISFAIALFGLLPIAAFAECDVKYITQDGDTLFSIAEGKYGDQDKWTLIYYSNQETLRGSVLQVEAGMELYIPCPPNETQTTQDSATPLIDDNAEMKLVTWDNYTPLADRSWAANGMLVELVNGAMEKTTDPVSYSLTWKPGDSKKKYPLLDGTEFDMSFPWLKPDCENNPDNQHCKSLHYSDPLIKFFVLLFVRKDASFTYETDADVVGKTLCRPKGFLTHDLDRPDRQWLKNDLVKLVRGANPTACFDLLMQGKVDAVAMNMFIGTQMIKKHRLQGFVMPLEKPLSQEAFHVVISKRHWRGTTHLYRINAGIAALKASGRYDKIVTRHLELYRKSLQE